MKNQQSADRGSGTTAGVNKRLGRGLTSLIPVPPTGGRQSTVDRSFPVEHPPSTDRARTTQSDARIDASQGSTGLNQRSVAQSGRAHSKADQVSAQDHVPHGTSDAAAVPAQQKEEPHADIQVLDVQVTLVDTNPHQPREDFGENSIRQLADSIRASGLLQPITVRPIGNESNRRYELIAGERRLRAVRLLGWERIPAIVRTTTERESAQLALIENIQRADLNPVERAFGLRSLIEDFDLTHQEAADSVGLDRATVTNLLRLTELDSRSLDLLRQGKITAGHARALLGLRDVSTRALLADTAIVEEWSVRTLEREVQRAADRAKASGHVSRGTKAPIRSAHIANLESELSRSLGTRVHIQLGRKKGAGRLTIEFFSLDQFDGLLHRLGVPPARAS